MKKRVTALLLAVCLLALTACGSSDTVSLTADISTSKVKLPAYEGRTAATEFAVKLLQGTQEQEGVLLSPMSVLCALALTVNGAAGDSLAQMEQTLGMTRQELNGFLSAYLRKLAQEETVHSANSLWLRNEENRLTVKQDYLQNCKDYLDAEIFSAAFDEGTCKDLNKWVSENTDGMIEKLLEEIPASAVAYLVNALSFDGAWETPYREDQLADGVFHGLSGEEECTMMYSREDCYLTGEHATGFMKYYDGYAFAALLPEEGMSVEDYVVGLSGAELEAMLDQCTYVGVDAGLPQFEGGSRLDLAEVLSALGMSDIFDAQRADLSALGSSAAGNLFVSGVIHETAIEVNESGTRASAATAVEISDACAAPEEEAPPQVILDRPFVYLIVDTSNMLPLFIGTVTNVG